MMPQLAVGRQWYTTTDYRNLYVTNDHLDEESSSSRYHLTFKNTKYKITINGFVSSLISMYLRNVYARLSSAY